MAFNDLLRLFLLLKLTKTYLLNRLGDSNLDILLRLNKEAPEKWSESDKDLLINLFMEKKARRGVKPRITV